MTPPDHCRFPLQPWFAGSHAALERSVLLEFGSERYGDLLHERTTSTNKNQHATMLPTARRFWDINVQFYCPLEAWEAGQVGQGAELVPGSELDADAPAVEVLPAFGSVEDVPLVDAVVESVPETPVDDVVAGGGSIFIPFTWVRAVP